MRFQVNWDINLFEIVEIISVIHILSYDVKFTKNNFTLLIVKFYHTFFFRGVDLLHLTCRCGVINIVSL